MHYLDCQSAKLFLSVNPILCIYGTIICTINSIFITYLYMRQYEWLKQYRWLVQKRYFFVILDHLGGSTNQDVLLLATLWYILQKVFQPKVTSASIFCLRLYVESFLSTLGYKLCSTYYNFAIIYRPSNSNGDITYCILHHAFIHNM